MGEQFGYFNFLENPTSVLLLCMSWDVLCISQKSYFGFPFFFFYLCLVGSNIYDNSTYPMYGKGQTMSISLHVRLKKPKCHLGIFLHHHMSTYVAAQDDEAKVTVALNKTTGNRRRIFPMPSSQSTDSHYFQSYIR